MGFAEPPGSPRALVRSYRTVSPLPDPATPENRRPSAVCSLWHFPASHLDWALPSILPCGVRTFLGRVTPQGSARTRPPGRLATNTILAAREPRVALDYQRGYAATSSCDNSAYGARSPS